MIITSNELAQQTGASYRQIDYWARKGIIPTVGIARPGQGHPRHHDDIIIPRVKLLVKVSNALGKNPKGDILKRVYNDFEYGFLWFEDGLILRWEDR